MIRRGTPRPGWADVALAVGACGLALLPPGHPPWAYGLAACSATLLVLRSRFPRLVLVGALPCAALGLGMFSTAIALHAVGRRLRGSRALWPWVGATTVAMLLSVLLGASVASPADWILTVTVIAAATTAPAALGALQATRAELTERVRELSRAEAARDLAISQVARAEERNRIAREVHDIVGHQTALIAVQAAGLQARSTEPETVEVARRLRELCSGALEEMRTVLRQWSDDDPLDPPPAGGWWAWVLDPAEVARRAGVAIRIDAAAELPLPPPAGVRLLRRAVQEGVANAIRHGTEPIEVRLDAPGPLVRLVVCNGLRPGGPARMGGAERGGRGLIGLRERAEYVGGRVWAGRDHSHGWVLEAVLDLREPPARHVGGAAAPEGRNEVFGEAISPERASPPAPNAAAAGAHSRRPPGRRSLRRRGARTAREA